MRLTPVVVRSYLILYCKQEVLCPVLLLSVSVVG
jgi:hypothetical protein